MNIHNMLHYEEKGKIAIEKEETLRLIIGVLGLDLRFLLYFLLCTQLKSAYQVKNLKKNYG